MVVVFGFGSPVALLLTYFLVHQSLLLTSSQNVNHRVLQAEQCENEKESFLWRVRRKGAYPPSYLFGTIHVPYSLVWDHVPLIVKHHFQQASFIYFELDLTDPYTLAALNHCQFLPRGERLNDTIPVGMYSRLRNYFEYVRSVIPQWIANADGDTDDGEYQYETVQSASNLTWPQQQGARASQLSKARLDYANYIFQTLTRGWEQKRPIWIMLLLNTLNENEFRYRGIPVLDLYLAQEALRRNKKTGAIERVEEQCVPLNRMNKSQIVFALNVTLSRLEYEQEHGRNMNESMLRAWRNPSEQLVRKYNCGNVRELVTAQQLASHVLVSSLDDADQRLVREVDSYFADELLFKRNVKMAERVRHIMEYHPQTTFFFAFGVGHFVGNRTVLELLRNAGYSVEHVPINKAVRRRVRPLRNATKSQRRRTTTPPVSHLPIDTWSLSFVEPSQRPAGLQSRSVPASRGLRLSGNRNRAGGELLDYYSFWDNVLQQYVATSRSTTAISRQLTTNLLTTTTARRTDVPPVINNQLLELAKRVMPLGKRKMDESRVIDITDDENENRRGRTRSNAACRQHDPGFSLSTCISIITTLCVIRYRRLQA